MEVLYCGWNGFGQMPGTANSLISKPTLIPLDASILSVSCSWSTIVTTTTSGEAVITGFVGGLPQACIDLKLPSGDKISQASTCQNHTLLLSSAGQCWKHVSNDNCIQRIVDFTKTEANTTRTAVMDKDFIVKVCCNDYVNLALSKFGQTYTIPSAVTLPGLRVIDVACGNSHCALLTDRGTVFTWGCGSRGQLGHGELESEENPRELDALGGLPVKSVSCGAWHCAAVTHDGVLYTWGWNSFGQLGITDRAEEYWPNIHSPVQKKRCLDNHAAIKGKNFNVALIQGIKSNISMDIRKVNASQIETTADASLPGGASANCLEDHTTNMQDQRVKISSEELFFEDLPEKNLEMHSKIACPLQTLPVPVDTQSEVHVVSCGARHTVVLLGDGSVWGCGWNSWGQLGISPSVCYQTNHLKQLLLPNEYQNVSNVSCGAWSTCILVEKQSTFEFPSKHGCDARN